MAGAIGGPQRFNKPSTTSRPQHSQSAFIRDAHHRYVHGLSFSPSARSGSVSPAQHTAGATAAPYITSTCNLGNLVRAEKDKARELAVEEDLRKYVAEATPSATPLSNGHQSLVVCALYRVRTRGLGVTAAAARHATLACRARGAVLSHSCVEYTRALQDRYEQPERVLSAATTALVLSGGMGSAPDTDDEHAAPQRTLLRA
jgi:hypothetical protein